jgi:hypothetical protein
MFVFGVGDAYFLPYSGSLAANPSPMQLWGLQETQIDISSSSKSLMGKTQFPLAIARTDGKITAKLKFSAQYVKILNDAFFGAAGTLTTGSTIGVSRQPLTLTSHAGTVSPPNSGIFATDQGCVDVTSGRIMYEVAAGPVAGVSYTRSGADYTFASAQGAVLVSYTYTATSGFTMTVANTAMGSQPIGSITVMNSQYINYDGAQNVLWTLPAVLPTKISEPFKYNDFTMVELDVECFVDSVGNVLYVSYDE